MFVISTSRFHIFIELMWKIRSSSRIEDTPEHQAYLLGSVFYKTSGPNVIACCTHQCVSSSFDR